jgi:flagellin
MKWPMPLWMHLSILPLGCRLGSWKVLLKLSGGDERLSVSLNNLGGGVPANGAQTLANLIDNPWGGTSDYYSLAYAAVRYMDALIKSGGGTGVNEITAYMAAHTDETLDQTIAANANLAANGVANLADFATKFKDTGAGGGVDYIKTTLIPALGNPDTGALTGSDNYSF